MRVRGADERSPWGEKMQVHRFQSPFKHWVSGLAVELAVFAVFVATLMAVTLFIAWAL
jgi:hypothetical protein